MPRICQDCSDLRSRWQGDTWGECQAAALGVKSDMGECPLVVCLTILEYVFPAYTLLCIPLASAVEQILILLSWLHVLQGQAKLLITTGVIDQPFWASNVLASGLLAVSLPNASSPYSLQLLCASLHQNLLDLSGDWYMIMWKVYAKDCTWSPNFGAFFLRADKILRLGGIGSLDFGVCYILVKDLISKSGLPGAILPSDTAQM